MSHPDSKSDLGPHSPMAAAIQSTETPRTLSDPETTPVKVVGKGVEVVEKNSMDKRDDSIDGGSMKPTYDHTHRKLKPRHVQLIGIGGTIGTALYVQIGSGLRTSGPGSLFLGFSICPSTTSKDVSRSRQSLFQIRRINIHHLCPYQQSQSEIDPDIQPPHPAQKPI
ncbi:unnamed protein product [Penicillium pancosmium]